MYDGETFKKMLSAAKSYPEDENNVLELDSGMVAKLCEYTESHWILQFEVVGFMVCYLYQFFKKLSQLSKQRPRQIIKIFRPKKCLPLSIPYPVLL